MNKIEYPLKFTPILKEKVWGGNKLAQVLHKKSDKNNIGESWEISDIQGDVSMVAGGKFKGKTLSELIKEFKGSLVGEKVYNEFEDKFPLLIKFIDAAEPLSIQLHPNDELARKRHNSFGKTEMWYVMQADPGSGLIVGFKKEVTKEEYLENLKNKTLTEILNFEEVSEGDVYFIPTGRVHAIKAGVMLAEIQQTSDITYRIYDWDRVDDQGNTRELHTKLALDAIDYSVQEIYKTPYVKKKNASVNIVDCRYFTTNMISFNKTLSVNYIDKDSFVIYMCVKGNAIIHYGEGLTESIRKGETVLIPASLKDLKLKPNGYTEILEIFIS